MNIFQDDGGVQPFYNPTDFPGVNPWGHPYPGAEQQAPLPPPPPDPPAQYIPSPGPYRSYKRSTSTAPPDPWAGVPGAVRDQANAITDKFFATTGYTLSSDANSIALALARSGTNITGSPFAAYSWLFQNALSDTQRQANPQAEFGMGRDDYQQTVSKLNSVMSDWTGSNFSGDDLKSAIRGSWTPDQIRNFAIHGNPEGTGDLLAAAQLGGDMPWLSQGQTFQQTEQGFERFEGHTPTDRATLGAWFRFGASARSLGGGAPATETVASRSLTSLGSEVR